MVLHWGQVLLCLLMFSPENLDEAIVSSREDIWSRGGEEDTVDKVPVQWEVFKEESLLCRPYLDRAFSISSDDLGSISRDVTAENSTWMSESGVAHRGIYIPDLHSVVKRGSNQQSVITTEDTAANMARVTMERRQQMPREVP